MGISNLYRFLQLSSEGRTSLKNADGVKVTIKGAPAERNVKSLLRLAETADVVVKMPKGMIDPTDQGVRFTPVKGNARMAVEDVVGAGTSMLRALEEHDAAEKEAAESIAREKAANEAAIAAENAKAAEAAKAAKENGKAAKEKAGTK